MTSPEMANRHARLAIFWIFGLCGVICSLWSASLPSINSRLHLGETRLGIVLLLVGAGAVALMPVTGRLCDRFGSRAVLRVGGPVFVVPLIGPALAPSFGVLLVLAFVLGAGIGSLDVAMNAHAIEVEKRYGRPIMSSFHGLWSVGGVIGSGVIAAGLHFGAVASALMITGAAVSALLLLAPGRFLLHDRDRTPAPHTADQAPDSPASGGPASGGPASGGPASGGPASGGTVPGGPVPSGTASGGPVPGGQAVVLLLGLIAAAGFICEGSAYNWAPLHAIRELHVDPATAALAYTIFAAALTAGRLTGDRLRRWLGPVRAMCWAGLIAVSGYLLVLLAPSLPSGRLPCDYAGWAVTGIGLATVVPSIFSAVGERDGGVGRALSLVAVCAYGGELAGPAVIGPLAGATSLRIAMLVPGGLAVLIAILGPVAIRRAMHPARLRSAPVKSPRPCRSDT